MVTVLKTGPAASSLTHSLLGITLVKLAWAAQCCVCSRRRSLIIPHSTSPNFVLGDSLKPHPDLAEVNGVPFLSPGDFQIWLSNSSNRIQKKRQIRQLSFVLTACQKDYLLVCRKDLCVQTQRTPEPHTGIGKLKRTLTSTSVIQYKQLQLLSSPCPEVEYLIWQPGSSIILPVHLTLSCLLMLFCCLEWQQCVFSFAAFPCLKFSE